MVLPQPKLHQVMGVELKPYDLMQAQLGNKALLDKLATMPILDGVLIEGQVLSPRVDNLVEHKLDRMPRGFIVVDRQFVPNNFEVFQDSVQTVTSGTTGELVEYPVEQYSDEATIFNASTERYIAQTTGLHWFEASVHVQTPAVDTPVRSILKVNGTEVARQAVTSDGATNICANLRSELYLTEDDYVEHWVVHVHGADRTTIVSSNLTFFRGGLVDMGIQNDAAQTDERLLYLRVSYEQTCSLWVY